MREGRRTVRGVIAEHEGSGSYPRALAVSGPPGRHRFYTLCTKSATGPRPPSQVVLHRREGGRFQPAVAADQRCRAGVGSDRRSKADRLTASALRVVNF